MVARRLGRNKKACIRIVYRAAARKKIMTEAMLMVKFSSAFSSFFTFSLQRRNHRNQTNDRGKCLGLPHIGYVPVLILLNVL